MAIEEITRRFKKIHIAENENNPPLHMVWKISINGIILTLKRYGSFCFWNQIVLEKKSEEVYRIELQRIYGGKGRKDIGERTEFFGNQLTRIYRGNRFSFTDYLIVAGRIERVPKEEELPRQVLAEKFARIYEERLREILSNR